MCPQSYVQVLLSLLRTGTPLSPTYKYSCHVLSGTHAMCSQSYVQVLLPCALSPTYRYSCHVLSVLRTVTPAMCSQSYVQVLMPCALSPTYRYSCHVLSVLRTGTHAMCSQTPALCLNFRGNKLTSSQLMLVILPSPDPHKLNVNISPLVQG